MYWNLLLAHLLADYPLQPDWLVRLKARNRFVLLHIAVHLAVLLVIAGTALKLLWPYFLTLSLIHLFIDLGKKYVNKLRPAWVVIPYVIDQGFHFLSILLVTLWISSRYPSLRLPISSTVAIYLVGYLLVTYIWFVSERVLAYTNEKYRQEVNVQFWPRMFARAVLLTVLLVLWKGFSPLASFIALPYLSRRFGYRMLAIDLAVTSAVFVFIRLALVSYT